MANVEKTSVHKQTKSIAKRGPSVQFLFVRVLFENSLVRNTQQTGAQENNDRSPFVPLLSSETKTEVRQPPADLPHIQASLPATTVEVVLSKMQTGPLKCQEFLFVVMSFSQNNNVRLRFFFFFFL